MKRRRGRARGRGLTPPGPIGPPAAQPPLDRIRQQATELEGVFLNTLMREMFSSLDTDNGFGGGFAEETWRRMQAEQLLPLIHIFEPTRPY